MNDIFISFDDFKRLYRRKKRKITLFIALVAVCAFCYFITRPKVYEASATFQQSASRSEQGFDLRTFMRSFAGAVPESSTTPVMLSRSVLSKTIEALGMQAQQSDGLKFKDVRYLGEKPSRFFVKLNEKKQIKIFDSHHRFVTDGEIGSPMISHSFQLTLTKVPRNFSVEKSYVLTLLPRRPIINDVKARIKIRPVREEKNILSIKFTDCNRHFAAAFVNTLMSQYEAFLIEENKTIIDSQLKYLDRRQNELHQNLEAHYQQHALLLKKNLHEKGFMGIQDELSFITQPLKDYQEKLDEIGIELASLEKRIAETTLEPSGVKMAHQLSSSLTTQIGEMQLALEKLSREEPLPLLPSFAELIQDVEQAKAVWKNSQEEPSRLLYLEKRDKLSSRLQVMLQHLSQRAKNLDQGAGYAESLEVDFHGMTLEAARNLFQNYCKQMDDLDSQLKQLLFFKDHLHEPHFEISTLSNVMSDAVSQQLVQRASDLEAQLCDGINRSPREHARIKEAIATQRHFLDSHLGQVIELGKIRIQLTREKMGALYHVMKDLLQKESVVFTEKIDELKASLHVIPDLWLLEKQLGFRGELMKGMMEGLTQITESKNLSRHLYQVESKPLDTALVPLNPVPSHSVVKSVLISFAAATALYLLYLITAFLKGLPLSLTTLRLMGAHTSGTLSLDSSQPLSQLKHKDLETLRASAAFLLERPSSSTVLLVGERGVGFSFNLAQLMAMHRKKVAVIDCNFDKIVDPEIKTGLWHYLQGEDASFISKEHYDFLPSGGNSPHGVELLASERFSDLLATCKKRYDTIFLLKQAPLKSQDALQLTTLTDISIVATYEETQDQLLPYLHLRQENAKMCTTFTQYDILTE